MMNNVFRARELASEPLLPEKQSKTSEHNSLPYGSLLSPTYSTPLPLLSSTPSFEQLDDTNPSFDVSCPPILSKILRVKFKMTSMHALAHGIGRVLCFLCLNSSGSGFVWCYTTGNIWGRTLPLTGCWLSCLPAVAFLSSPTLPACFIDWPTCRGGHSLAGCLTYSFFPCVLFLGSSYAFLILNRYFHLSLCLEQGYLV